MLTGGVLGREAELAVLRAAVAAASGPGACLLLTGEPGIGKSTLLSAAAETADRAGCTVLRASGVESEVHLPFGGVHQVLTRLVRHLSDLPDGHQDAVATVFGLVERPSIDPFLIADAAFLLMLRESAERPVVVLVDDLQWLDPQSQQILSYVAHRGAGAGFTVVAASRPDYVGSFDAAGFSRLDVGGVDDASAEQILHAHAGTLGAAELLQVRLQAQGNPLALLELPLSWDGGPSAGEYPMAMSVKLERAFAGRVLELPAGARDALLIAAVGSSSRTGELVQAMSAFGTPEASAALLGPAVAAGLLTGDRSHVTFRHPLVRSAILRAETTGRRRAAHAALARVLDADRYRQSWHRAFSIAGPDDDIAQALVDTVGASLRRGAVMAAVSSLERAAQLTLSSALRGERLLMAAGHAFEAGRPDVVGRLLREASVLELRDLDRLRVTWLTEALNGDISPNSLLVRHLLDSAVLAGDLGNDELALNILLAAALRCWWADGADDRSAAVAVLDGWTASRTDARYLAALAIAAPVLRGAQVKAGLDAALPGMGGDGDVLRVYALAAYGIGDLVVATDLLDLAEAAFRRQGRLGMLPVVLALQLHIRLDLGDWAGADAAGREVITVSRQTGQAVYADNNVLVDARAMALRGEWEGALELMARVEADAWHQHIDDRVCLAYQARGTALLSADRPADAFDCLRRQYDDTDPGYHQRESFGGVALLAEAAVAGGSIEVARRIVAGLEAVAVLTCSPLLEVNLLYARAVLATDGERARRFLQARSADLTRWPWVRARVLLAHGRWLAGDGRSSAAREDLHAAADLFARLGAARWLRSARASLAALDRQHRDRR